MVTLRRAALLLLLAACEGAPPAPATFPAAPPPPEAPAFEDFAGAATCRECHDDQHDAWRGSTHARAGGDPADVRLLKAFDGVAIRFRDARVIPRRTGDTYRFVVERADGRTESLTIAGVVGGGHMVGGGTQGFVTRMADGTLRFLPWELARIEGVWFCNTGTRAGGGWLPITTDLRLADCGDWPPVRALGEQSRLATCQGCHGSQIDVTAEPGRPNATRLATLAIDCEACHGPGVPHIAAARAGAADLRMRTLETLGEEASNAVCFSCHALKDALRPGYLAGADLTSFYSLFLPLLSDAPVLPDGRIRTFAYQQGHLWSDCYLAGTMTCADCHDPHSQDYRDVNGFALDGRFDDRQCTSCHPSKATAPETHTMHAPGSSGSRCVSCHMPYLQEPDVGDALRYARSDHTIPVPRPASDAALGVEVACAQCHVDVGTQTLQAQVRERWGEIKPRRTLVQGLIDAGSRPDRTTLVRLLESDPRDHDAATFLALGTLLRDHLRADERLDDALRRRLEALAAEPQPDIAAAALAALHWAMGSDPDMRTFLAGRLQADATGDVRRRWVVLLGFLGDRAREADRPLEALVAYDRALELDGRAAGVLANRGLAEAALGDQTAAIASYQASLAIDSLRSLTWVNLGIAHAATGNVNGAEQTYRAALRIDPHEPLAAFNLGNLYLRADRAAEAAMAYRQAVASDPGLAPAWFNLARALIALQRPDSAALAIRAGLEFDPDNAPAREFLQQLEAGGG